MNNQEPSSTAVRHLRYKYHEGNKEFTPRQKRLFLEDSLTEAVEEIEDLRMQLQNVNQLATELAQQVARLESQRFNKLSNHPNLKRVTTNEREGGFTFWF